jgi:uncharacterized SAM-binding protein YcdF (DUF218 family)
MSQRLSRRRPHSPNSRTRLSRNWQAIARRVVRTLLIGLGLFFICSLGLNLLRLSSAATAPVDAVLVLGGSIQREIRAAELSRQHPAMPVLISTGSPDPCIWLIFQRTGAPIGSVWLEKCADSTFTNFYFSLPILQQWHAHKVKLVTSAKHLPRAEWLAAILLGAHGIWVEPEIVVEQGIPANQETRIKTGLDVTRSLLWAIVSQIYQPRCAQVRSLTSVDLKAWPPQSFRCERQGNLRVEVEQLGILKSI